MNFLFSMNRFLFQHMNGMCIHNTYYFVVIHIIKVPSQVNILPVIVI